MRFACSILFAAGLLMHGVDPAAARTRSPARLVEAYGSDRGYRRGDYRSPDGRYILRVTYPDTHGNLDVLTAEGKGRLVHAECFTGFIWSPKHPHRLVVSTSGVYGQAMLALWEGGRGWRHLARVKKPIDEYFRLFGVTEDGRTAVYSHAILDHPDFANQIERRRTVSLSRKPGSRVPREAGTAQHRRSQ